MHLRWASLRDASLREALPTRTRTTQVIYPNQIGFLYGAVTIGDV
ncbi:MAG: hypothetical protein RMY36_009055 [Nostoc sp. SerVER01]